MELAAQPPIGIATRIGTVCAFALVNGIALGGLYGTHLIMGVVLLAAISLLESWYLGQLNTRWIGKPAGGVLSKALALMIFLSTLALIGGFIGLFLLLVPPQP